ncbi:MAG: polyprenyl diphosphate synthase [Nitrososphaeria archaeon]|jgi:tritrans,polycis-undecaprenyl-diphosphate synthase [geranylgeranyl-diphosphate specific]
MPVGGTSGSSLYRIARLLIRAIGGYRLYEWLLERQVLSGPIPAHVGIVLDGNRRWAEERGLPRWLGHRYGADRLEEALRWILDLGVRTTTVYALSIENMERRPREEVDRILELIRERALRLAADPLVHGRRVRVRLIGDRSRLPPEVRGALEEAERATEGYDSFFLNLAIAYSGRDEIVRAARRAAEMVASGALRPEDIDEELMSSLMYTGGLPDPDLIIRTSGETRLSGFLLWQSAYSEFVILDVYWPEFRRIDLLRAIRTYQGRSRRFGG